MTVTLADLITTETEDDVLALLIAEAQSRGLLTTDWEEGSPELTIAEMFAGVIADLVSDVTPAIVGGGFVSTATAGWLKLNALERYNLTSIAAVSTVGTVTLTAAAGAGPYTITAGRMRFAYTANPEIIYTNTTGGVLALGGTLAVTVVADEPGAASAAVAADIITTMLTPLAGVTVSNPALAITAATAASGNTSQGGIVPSAPGAITAQTWRVKITQSGQLGVARFSLGQGTNAYAVDQLIPGGGVVIGVDGSGLTLTFTNHATVNPSFILGDVWTFTSPGTWYTTTGADEETDAALRVRCLARWPALGSVPTEDVYESWAKEASASVYYARAVANPASSAAVALTVAGNGATIPAATVTAIQDYVDARKPLTDLPTVAAATEVAITITGATVLVSLGLTTVAIAQAAAQANVDAYIRSVGIGDGSAVVVRWARILEEIMAVEGIVDCTGLLLNGATANVTVASNTIKTYAGPLSTTLTAWTAVS